MRSNAIIKCLLIFAVLLPLFITSSYGQLTKLWKNDYPYNQDSGNIYFGNLQGNRLQFDASNNPYYFSEFAPAGNEPGSFTYNAQMQTAKYNPAGTALWTHRDTSIYQNNCNQCGLSFFTGIVSSDGISFNIGTGGGNYSVLTCTQANGQPKWRNTFNTFGVTDVVQDNAGNTIVTSNSYPVEPQYRSQYILLMKVNKAGNTNWTTQYSAPDGLGWLQNQKCVADASGKLYVAASTYLYADSGRSAGNLFLTNFDTAGNKLWDKKIDSLRGWQVGDAIFNTTDSSVYITVCSNILIPSDDTVRVKLIKVSNQGEVVWTKTQPAPQYLSMRLKRDNSGNIYWWHKNGQYGNVYSMNYAPEGEIDKYNPAGQMIGIMYGSSFDVDASGYTYTAHSYSKNDSGYCGIRKYSANGSLLYDYPAFSYPGGPGAQTSFYAEVLRDKQSNVYVLKDSSLYPNDHSTISITKYSAACSGTAAPAKPKSIAGPATLYCDANSYAYSCPAVVKATNYYWTVPDGMMIDSGQGTTKIYIHRYSFAAFNKGLVSVYAANCYGASAVVSKAVTDSLKVPAKITGPTSVCKGQTNVEYTAATVVDAQRYQWTIPAGASFSQGFSGTEPTVHIDFGSSGGKVSVYALNACDSSIAKSVQVKVTNCVAGMSVEASFDKSIVYPNPSAGAFALRFGNGYHSTVSVIVKDVSGKVVEQLSSVTGNSVCFGGKLTKGVYFVEVMSGGEKEVLKVVKE